MQWQSVLEFVHRKLCPSSLLAKVDEKRNEHDVMSLMMSNADVGEILTMWLEKQNELKKPKCSKQAKFLKDEGNVYFKRNHFPQSIESYTKSARHAPFDNGDYSISLANRSAAFFHLGQYKRCLEDIAVAFASNYAEKLSAKLHLRAAQCWIKLHDGERANEQLVYAQNLITNCEEISANDKGNMSRQIAELTLEINRLPENSIPDTLNDVVWRPEDLLPPNPMYPSASSSLELNYSPTKGRYVTAQKDINQGDVLYVEKPFAFVALDHVISDSTCVHCCSYIDKPKYPCRGCTHALYCSKSCWENSWSSYHKWECIGYNMKIWEQIGIAHLALKVLFSSIGSFDKVRFNDVQKLVTNIDKMATEDLIIYSITAMMLVQYLELYTDLLSVIDMKECLVDKFMDEKPGISFDVSCHEDKKLFVGTLLLRHMLQLIANGHAITRLNLTTAEGENIFEEQQQRVAVGIYPSVSMMNHSCDPNIMNTFWNDYLIVKATKDIPAGGEVFNCYGPHFRRMRLKERRNSLMNQYCFICQCEPCTNPKLQNFLDRFSAMRCSDCEGPVIEVNLNSSKCLNCGSIYTATVRKRANDELKSAAPLFNSAQDLMQSGNIESAFDNLERCLGIRQKWLFRYHDDITITYDALGKCCVMMNRYYDSVSYLEKSILAVEEKFGIDSVEIANELNKITDICLQYLQQAPIKNDLKYRNMVQTTESFLKRAEKIMNMLGGPWSEVYREISYKEQELSDMLQNLRIQQ